MQPKFTLIQRARFVLLTPLLAVMLCLFAGNANAQQYVNGVLSTGATSVSGTAAPAGTTWSECQNPTGDLTIANTNAGYGAQITGNASVADDFTVPAGSWNLTKITVYAYSTGYAGATSPFNDLRLQIHSGNPLSGPTTIVYGDLTTNRLTASNNSNVFRIFNTVVPPATAAATNRIVWTLEATVNVTLPAGTYWLEYQTGTALASNFTPPSSPVGVRTLPGYNAIQRLGTAWAALVDAGQGPASPANVAVDFPFIIDYTTGACAGTPNPGNTIASAPSACAGTNFTLSLQNGTAGSGVTYQWQSASAVGGPYTDIVGATSASLTTTLSATTFYRANVTCSGNTGTSTPVQVALTPASSCYCIPPASDCTDNDMITRVIFSTLNNASTCGSGPPAGYTNYTALPAPNVIAGGPNPITVEAPANWTEQIAVWIDYNKNGQFETTEFTFVGTKPGGLTSVSGNVNIPASALLGNTRMRVRTRFSTALAAGDACLGFTFGETEDYTVNIVPCVPITITAPPANRSVACGSGTTFTVATTGSLPVYGWEYRVNATSSWQNVTNGGVYSGATTSTLTLSNVPGTMSGYQYRALVSGACSAIDFSAAATLTVTPIVATVNPTAASICLGGSQQLTLTNAASPATATFSSGAVNVPIPDANLTGINNTIAVTGIPAGSVISNISVTLNITHAWVSDLEVVLRAPNGQIINLSDLVSATNQSGANFTNTVFSSTGTAALSTGVRPGYTGTFKADAIPGPTGGFGVPAGPTGFLPTTTTWTALQSTPSGNWTLAMYDAGAPDAGTLNNWSIAITYGAPATGVWTASPATPNTMFTDAGLTIPYVAGSQANSIYVNPTVNTNYSVVYSTATPCTSEPTVIPVTVVTPLTNVVNPQNTSVCVGSNGTLTVSATGGPATYQWQVSTDGGTTWTNIAGATNATLSLNAVTSSMNNNRYRAILTAAPCAGSVTSGSAILTVNALPVVTLSAQDVSLTPNQTATLNASSTPASSPNGWTWTYNGNAIPGTGNTQVVNVDHLGIYQATVVDVNGCENTSNELEITAEAGDKLWIYPNPTTGQFQVRLFYGSNVSERRTVTIYNQLGQVMMSKRFDLVNSAPYLQMDFDLSHLPRGIYAVKVAHQFTGKVTSGLVILE